MLAENPHSSASVDQRERAGAEEVSEQCDRPLILESVRENAHPRAHDYASQTQDRDRVEVPLHIVSKRRNEGFHVNVPSTPGSFPIDTCPSHLG